MATAAHAAKVYVGAASPAATEVDGLNDASLQMVADLLDTTDFADTTGYRTRIQGLKDDSFSLSGDFEPADTAQILLQTSRGTGADIFVRFLPDGTNGFEVACKVASISLSGTVDGKTQISYDLQGTGAATAVP